MNLPNPPPEEKLLRLIRGQTSQPSSGTPASAPDAKADARVQAPVLRARRWNFSWVTGTITALGLILIMEVGGLVMEATRRQPVIVAPRQLPVPAASANASTTPFDEMPTLASSVSGSVFASSPSSSTASVRAMPSATAKQLASRLTLMGIVSGEPAQAIIEDAQTKKTYFAVIGQMVVEGALVEQILQNRVVLDMNGEKIELAL